MPVVPSATIRYYKTLSPDDIIEKQDNIAKWVFNVKGNIPEANFWVDDMAYLYYQNKKPYNILKENIKNKKQALKILKEHTTILHQKLNLAMSGNHTPSISAAFFAWDNLLITELRPSLSIKGKLFYSWIAVLHISLPGVEIGRKISQNKIPISGEYIEIEFNASNIINLTYKHLPIVSSAVKLLKKYQYIQSETFDHVIALYRSGTDNLFPYYNLGTKRIPAIENLDEIIYNDDYNLDLPQPIPIGNDSSLLQVVSGTKPDYISNTPGSINMKMNYSIQLISELENTTLNPNKIKSTLINNRIEDTYKNNMSNLIVDMPPDKENPISIKILDEKTKKHTSDYYNLTFSVTGNIDYNKNNNIWKSIQWSLSPMLSSKGIIYIDGNWPEKHEVVEEIAIYALYKKQILEAQYYKNKKVPSTSSVIVNAIDKIHRFCHMCGLSMSLIGLIEDNPDNYRNYSLIVGKSFYKLTENDMWLKNKLSEYNILLFPTIEESLITGPNTPRKDMKNEFIQKSIFNIAYIIADLYKFTLMNKVDFDFKYKANIIKNYQVLNFLNKTRILVVNPNIKNTDINEILAYGLLDMFSDRNKDVDYELLSDKILNCITSRPLI